MGCEHVTVSDVACIGKIEKVVVVAELESEDEWRGFAGMVGQAFGEGRVALTVDTGGPDGCGQHSCWRGFVEVQD